MFKKFGAAIFITSLSLGIINCECDRPPQIKELDSYITNFIEEDKIPGVSAAIVADGKVAWSKGYGYANLETKQPMSADTSFFEIASVSKVFTATALMIAQEQGFLSLDDDISKILATEKAPFEINRPENSLPITFRHLASHTSGIVDSDDYICSYLIGEGPEEYQIAVNLPEYASFGYHCPEDSPVDLEGFLAGYLDQDGIFYNVDNFADYAPGERFQYSNIATALEGYLIGLTTGIPLDQYAKKRIFNRLGMRHTSWNYKDIDPNNIAVPYQLSEKDQKIVPFGTYSSSTWPDGALKSSADDLGRFLGAIMNYGTLNGTRILSKKSVREMLDLKTIQVADNENTTQIGIHWHAGTINDRHVIGHNGGDPGVLSFLYFDPEKHVGVVLLVNRDDLDADSEQHLLTLLELLFENGEKLKGASVTDPSLT